MTKTVIGGKSSWNIIPDPLIQPSIRRQAVSSCGHGNQIKKEPGGGGAGAAGRIEGRAGTDGQHDAGATQGRGAQGGSGPLVKKTEKGLEYY